MPSLSDYLGGLPTQSVSLVQGELASERERAQRRTALTQSLLSRRLQTRILPQIASTEAARGTFFSGGARLRATQATEDTEQAAATAGLQLEDILADLRRRQLLANLLL